MTLVEKIKTDPKLKKLAIWFFTPKGQARPRRWVQFLLFPFYVKRGKGALIRKRVRMDVLPNNSFYLGDKSTIEDFCTINNGVGRIIIGNETRIGIGSVLIGPIQIGNYVRLAQNVVVSALNHNYEDITRPISEQGINTNEIYIGDETWIGANAVILPGLFIGKHCIIAAGSVVTKNVPSYSVVAGNPAKIIKTYESETNKWVRFVS
nr:acyltransferase [uncultured Carboxylicivirga sp.]